MRKPWNVNWVRRGDITGGFAMAVGAALYVCYILIVAIGYLLAGIFLLIRWLIRRHRAKRQAGPGLPTARRAEERSSGPARTARTTTIRFLDEEAEVTYRPDRITTEMWDVAGRGVSNADDEICNRFVSQLVVNWDVTKADKPYPLTPDALRELPAVFIKTVFAQLIIDAGNRDRALLAP